MKNIIYLLILFSSTISYSQISKMTHEDSLILITPRSLLEIKSTSNTSNTELGTDALRNNTTGFNNTAIGANSLSDNTKGNSNTANGANSLILNTTGNYNTANGVNSLRFNREGFANSSSGVNSLYSNTIGANNTANGANSLYENKISNNNTATGAYSLRLNNSGNSNTATGAYSLYQNTTGSENTAIGYKANVSVGNLSNTTALGANAIVNASNKVRIGNARVTVIEGQVAWSYPSDRRLKENIKVNNYLGLNFINKLQPISYNYISDNTKVRHDGFIAQDIEAILKDLNLQFSGLKKSSDGMYSLAYSDFVMPLVNAIKEQQTIISDLIKKNDTYESQILKLSSKLEEIEKRYPVGN